MIPRRTVQISGEVIGHALPRSYGTLLNGRHAIIPTVLSLLQEAVPVKGCPFLWPDDVIANSCRDGVTPIGFNGWSGESSVDEQGTAVYAIGGDVATSNVKLIFPSDTYRCQWRRFVLGLIETHTGTWGIFVGIGVADSVSAPWFAGGKRLDLNQKGMKGFPVGKDHIIG